nr:MAG TPA: hypothetical protein [Caudoviricetes sp.]
MVKAGRKTPFRSLLFSLTPNGLHRQAESYSFPTARTSIRTVGNSY